MSELSLPCRVIHDGRVLGVADGPRSLAAMLIPLYERGFRRFEVEPLERRPCPGPDEEAHLLAAASARASADT